MISFISLHVVSLSFEVKLDVSSYLDKLDVMKAPNESRSEKLQASVNSPRLRSRAAGLVETRKFSRAQFPPTSMKSSSRDSSWSRTNASPLSRFGAETSSPNWISGPNPPPSTKELREAATPTQDAQMGLSTRAIERSDLARLLRDDGHRSGRRGSISSLCTDGLVGEAADSREFNSACMANKTTIATAVTRTVTLRMVITPEPLAY
jgi:hypothetical protein